MVALLKSNDSALCTSSYMMMYFVHCVVRCMKKLSHFRLLFLCSFVKYLKSAWNSPRT